MTTSAPPAAILKKTLSAALFLVLIFSCAGPAGSQGATDRPNPPLATADLRIGSALVKAEIADSELERNRGLMFRKSLADGRGMLFVFEKDTPIAFWMKNTLIPLSLAYLSSDGTIIQILELVPQSMEPRASERSVRYALEVPAGWFERVGVKVGDKVLIPSLK
jgi:uncharacterized membrane protein (UPF0127 family)